MNLKMFLLKIHTNLKMFDFTNGVRNRLQCITACFLRICKIGTSISEYICDMII